MTTPSPEKKITRDDRAEFEATRSQRAVALWADPRLRAQSLEVTSVAEEKGYSHVWSWLGVPIIQMPPDIIGVQEILWKARPDVVIETGVARGGSLIFYASIMELVGKGKVVGIDIDIRPHNRDSIERHELSKRIELIEGSSTAVETLAKVRSALPAGAKVMVILDSDHSKQHVLDELRLYAPLVSVGQYLVVADTMLGFLEPTQTPTYTANHWPPGNEPLAAMREYLLETDRFEPDAEMNGKMLFSSSPGGYLRCIKP